MQQILVTPMPEFSFASRMEGFFHSVLFSDLLTTSIALGALGFAFYMFYSFSKHGKFGRDASEEAQDHDNESLVDLGLIEPIETKTYTEPEPIVPPSKTSKAKNGNKRTGEL